MEGTSRAGPPRASRGRTPGSADLISTTSSESVIREDIGRNGKLELIINKKAILEANSKVIEMVFRAEL